MKNDIRCVLTVAGSDSGGGAGIQADLKTISAFGHYGMSAITAVTAQNTLGVSMTMAVGAEMMRAQLDAVLSDIFPHSAKTGMMMNGENVRITAELFKVYGVRNIVCDTVIMSSSGRQLLDDEGLSSFVDELMPLADIVTPNIPEAERLCGMKISGIADMEKAAGVLSGMTKGAVLIKGGHLDGNALDILYYDGKIYTYEHERIDNPNTHGTGCTLSSAIACGLAEGLDMPCSVKQAKEYITAVISAGLDIGKGIGPMWHFPNMKG